MICAKYLCGKPIARGAKFHCEEHAAPLARVREQLENERGTLRSVGNGRKKRAGKPTCCNPACRQERVPPSVFCEDCIDEGWVQEDLGD